MRGLQRSEDVAEGRPWRRDHPYVGERARRYFPVPGGDGIAPYDGKIDGWLPPEADDPPLWHLQMGDGDDEELDEAEARNAIQHYAEGRLLPAGGTAEAEAGAEAWAAAAEAIKGTEEAKEAAAEAAEAEAKEVEEAKEAKEAKEGGALLEAGPQLTLTPTPTPTLTPTPTPTSTPTLSLTLPLTRGRSSPSTRCYASGLPPSAASAGAARCNLNRNRNLNLNLNHNRNLLR